jgi:DNA-nicking Smr family endonuclease
MDKKECKHSNSEDEALFRDSVGGAKPLQTPKRHVPEKSRPPRAPLTHQAEAESFEASRTGETELPESALSDELVFQRDNVSRRKMRELRRGKYAIQEEIDLHGCTRDEARDALQSFIEHCVRRGLTCVRVVHGKGHRSGPGGPILKVAVNGWLRRWEPVQAFCPARNSDGGSGAIYVLFRNH